MRGVVAIVGRPNVGKSSLFNRIVGERLSITDDASGVTRDRIYARASWLNQTFSIIDTGGIILRDEPFSSEIRAQAELAIDEADLIIFVVDARTGITFEDEDVINLLNHANKPLICAANKVDDGSLKDLIYEFYSLGVEHVIPVSALHGIGIGDLLDLTIELLPEKKEKKYPEGTIKFALIGQPNVGKSSLFNAIIGEERVIVSEVPGTTRDAIDTSFTKDGKSYVVIDTAGIRKQGKIYENTEKYSVMRAMQAIERCDVAVIILDANELINEQDRRIAGFAREYNRALIIVVNKWDLIIKDNKTMNEFTKKIYHEFQFIDFAPIVFLSALKNERVHLLMKAIDEVYTNFNRRVVTGVLNDILQDAIYLNQPPIFNGNRIKLTYATQSDVAPPTFVLFVNKEEHMHFSYLRYLENRIRDSFEFSGSPIKFVLRKKD